jgi:alcohol dehydrogenase class IV
MKKTLLVCSPSTRKYFLNIDEYKMITSPLSATEAGDLKDSEESVIAVGGGAVIDAAKIICRNPIICYPTTASGTSFTSHSVCWDNHKKISIKVPTPKAVIVREEFLESLPDSVIRKTKYDAVSHCLDSMWSSRSTDRSTDMASEALNMLLNYDNLSTLITAGNLAGRTISVVPTTILHSLSYPLTGMYGVSHGEALGFLLESVCEVMGSEVAKELSIPKLNVGTFSINDVSEEALTYSKLQDTSKNFDLQDVKKIYRDAIRRNSLKR